jgi:hypothetical protein
MGWLLPILSGLMTSDLQDAIKRAKRSAALALAIAVLGLTAYVFLMLAAFIKLAETRGNLDAALILAVGTLVAGGLLCGAMGVAGAIARRKAARRHADYRSQIAVAMSALPLVLRSKPLMIAAAIGALVFLGTRDANDAD